jgi:uncharacterized membrane protein
MFKHKKFEVYLLKNRLTGLVISFVLLAVTVLLAARVNLLQNVRIKDVRSVDEIATATDAPRENVRINIERANFAGFESYDNSELQGRYYYSEQDGKFLILLLNSDEDVVVNYTAKARVISGGDTYEEIVQGLADSMDISTQQMKAHTFGIIIDEVGYQGLYYKLILAMLILMVIVFGVNLFLCIYYMIYPWKEHQLADSLGKDATKATIEDIDRELVSNIFYNQEGVTITDSYFISHTWRHTGVLPISRVETFKKLKTSANFGNKPVFKLIMVDESGDSYEQNFKSEQAVDEVLSFLK